MSIFTNKNEELKKQLSAREIAIVASEYEQKKKSWIIAYLLWFFCGPIGIHRFFTRDYIRGLIQLVLSGIGGLLSFIGIGFLILWIPGLFWIIDCFFLYSRVGDINKDLEYDLMKKYKGTAPDTVAARPQKAAEPVEDAEFVEPEETAATDTSEDEA